MVAVARRFGLALGQNRIDFVDQIRGNAGPGGCADEGTASGISAASGPGFDDRTITRSHINTASSMLCVTSSTDLIGSFRSRHISTRSVRNSLGGQHVERGKRLVHQEQDGFDHDGARAKPTRWRMPPESSRG